MPTPTDLPTRLRYGVHCPASGVGEDTDLGRDMLEAIDTIERLQAENQALRAWAGPRWTVRSLARWLAT